jgi:hypothetical protein
MSESGVRAGQPISVTPPTVQLVGKVKFAFLGLSLLAVVAVHMPTAPFEVQASGHGFANLVGQELSWTMFSADPRGTSLDLWADMVLANGSRKQWRIDRNRVGGDFAYYHWVQWMETAVLEPDKAQLEGLADWLAAVSSGPVNEVTVYSKQRLGVPPGQPVPISEVAELGRFTPSLPQ